MSCPGRAFRLPASPCRRSDHRPAAVDLRDAKAGSLGRPWRAARRHTDSRRGYTLTPRWSIVNGCSPPSGAAPRTLSTSIWRRWPPPRTMRCIDRITSHTDCSGSRMRSVASPSTSTSSVAPSKASLAPSGVQELGRGLIVGQKPRMLRNPSSTTSAARFSCAVRTTACSASAGPCSRRSGRLPIWTSAPMALAEK